ncbi:MAG: DUF6519 domain-containing protein [Cellvibrio sp.]
MKGDFSRLTFDPKKHFSRVLQQQGRVQLDADWNEQSAILLHYLQTLAGDLIGDHGGPKDDVDGKIVKRKKLGFDLITDPKAIDNFSELSEQEKKLLQEKLGSLTANGPFLIGKGRYYVDGLLAEVDDFYGFYQQPDYPWEKDKTLEKGFHLIYLDVWERHITSFEDESIREVALNGADTASRAQLVWQVKAFKVDDSLGESASLEKDLDFVGKELQPKNRGRLKVQAKQDQANNEPCIIAPQSTYRGLENQLYRVEVYGEDVEHPFKFKWSRDNASIVTGAKLVGSVLKVDDPRGFSPGQWVEMTNDDQEKLGLSGVHLKIKSIEENELTLSPHENEKNLPAIGFTPTKARRWDGAEIIIEESRWLKLADGISIEFQPADEGEVIHYRTGDYWLIPARTATANIEWPTGAAKPPFGVEHHYAPLALINIQDQKVASNVDLRKVFSELAIPISKLKK